jgi:hypothetical protein
LSYVSIRTRSLSAHPLVGYLVASQPADFNSDHFSIDPAQPTIVRLPHGGDYVFLVRWGQYPGEAFKVWDLTAHVKDAGETSSGFPVHEGFRRTWPTTWPNPKGVRP